MKFTTHGWTRWQQRCHHLDWGTEMAGAKRPSKRVRKTVDFACNKRQQRGTDYYLLTPGGAVLVVGVDDVVITTFMLAEAKRRARIKQAAQRRRDET